MGACCLTMKGQKHVSRTVIVQHDDRAILHSRTVSNTRTDAIGDAVMIYKASWKQFRWTPSRGNICSTDAVQRLPSTPNSLKLQEQRKAFSPIRKVRAISQKLYSHSKPPNPPRHTSRGFLHWRFAHPGPGARGAVSVGPASANLHNRYRNGYPPDVRFSLRTHVVGPPLHILKVPQQQSHALQQRADYSIASSAMASSVGGMLRPRLLSAICDSCGAPKLPPAKSQSMTLSDR
jgi:hypothetical protein